MFKAQFKDQKFIKGLFEAISAILTEIRLLITPEKGLELKAMDGSHICLVHLDLKKEDMDLFEAKESYELGINLDDLVKILKRGSAKDTVTLSHDPKDKKLVIEMQAENAKKARKFTMALIDLDVEEIDIDQLNNIKFVNKTCFELSILDEAIKDAEIFAEVLTIRSQQILQFSAEGTMGDMEYAVDAEELIYNEFNGTTEGAFAIQFLKNLLKITTIATQIELSLLSESPLKAKIPLGNNSSITYYLAPRVEEDSDSMYEEY